MLNLSKMLKVEKFNELILGNHTDYIIDILNYFPTAEILLNSLNIQNCEEDGTGNTANPLNNQFGDFQMENILSFLKFIIWKDNFFFEKYPLHHFQFQDYTQYVGVPSS